MLTLQNLNINSPQLFPQITEKDSSGL